MNGNKRNITETSPELNNTTKKHNSNFFSNKMAIGNMSIDDFKKLLNETIYEQVKDLATKLDVASLSLELDALRTENSHLSKKLSVMTERCDLLESQIEIISRKAHENCMVVHLPLDRETDAVQLATQTCRGLLKLKEGEDIHLKKSRVIQNTHTQRGTVFLELESSDIVDEIMSVNSQLKGTGISIFREQTQMYRQKRRALMEIKNKLSQLNAQAKIIIKGDKMQINNHTFIYKFARGLIVKTAAEMTYMNNMFGDSSQEYFDCSDGVKIDPVDDRQTPHTSQPMTAPPRPELMHPNINRKQ